ncbi:hypothetical protein LJC19_08180, partial [Oxalobacter sp. OttesenSCG-928-P03]|nr:hypothetical protein [Oxalobacter sp. OttesenSCG-928-P03]
MKFEPIVEFLEHEFPGVLVAGKTLFINQMPATATEGFLLKESFTGTEIDPDIPLLRRGKFQLAGRGKDGPALKKMMEEISTTLTMQNVDLTGIQVKMMRPLY